MNLKRNFFRKIFTIAFLLVSMPNVTLLGMLQRPTPIRPNKKGQAILVLGTSSAGKSRVCKEGYDFLSKMLHGKDIVRIAMDEEEDKGISKDTRRNFPSDWSNEHILLYQNIVENTSKDKIALCDLMLFESEEEDTTESFITKLKETTNVFSVLVYCSMNRLLENVSLRNSSDDEWDRRSPSGVIGQFLGMYCSNTSSDNEEIDTISETDVFEGIETLSKINLEKYEIEPTEQCLDRLRNLSVRTPSPALIKQNVYDLILKNKGNGKKFDKKIGLLFYKLFGMIKQLENSLDSNAPVS